MTFPLASRIALRRFAVYWYVRHGAPVTVTDVNNDPGYAYVQARSGRPSTVIPVMWLFDVVIVQDQFPASSKICVGLPEPSYVMLTARPRRRSCNRVK